MSDRTSQTAVCVIDDAGPIVFEGKARSEPGALAKVPADRLRDRFNGELAVA
jgi:hypothetical protein